MDRHRSAMEIEALHQFKKWTNR